MNELDLIKIGGLKHVCLEVLMGYCEQCGNKFTESELDSGNCPICDVQLSNFQCVRCAGEFTAVSVTEQHPCQSIEVFRRSGQVVFMAEVQKAEEARELEERIAFERKRLRKIALKKLISFLKLPALSIFLGLLIYLNWFKILWLMLEISDLGDALTYWLQGAAIWVFNGIGSSSGWLWDCVVWFFHAIGTAVGWLWDCVVWFFRAIGTAVGWLWDSIVWVFNAVMWTLNAMLDVLGWIWSAVTWIFMATLVVVGFLWKIFVWIISTIFMIIAWLWGAIFN